MNSIEFYTFEKDVRFVTGGKDEQLTEDSHEVIVFMIDQIKELYPGAHKGLIEIFGNLSFDPKFKQFRMVKRFCKCNFGEIRQTPSDVDSQGRFCFEKVACPLKGECQFENVICNPKFNARISDSEMRVLELVFKGCEKEYIADKLCLSMHTVNNHIRNAYTRLGFHEKAEFIDYAHRNSLFKD